jgi:hypothetical protein
MNLTWVATIKKAVEQVLIEGAHLTRSDRVMEEHWSAEEAREAVGLASELVWSGVLFRRLFPLQLWPGP